MAVGSRNVVGELVGEGRELRHFISQVGTRIGKAKTGRLSDGTWLHLVTLADLYTVAVFDVEFVRMTESAALVACAANVCSSPGKNMDEQRGTDVHPELLLLFACSSLPQAMQAKKEKADRTLLRRVAHL